MLADAQISEVKHHDIVGYGGGGKGGGDAHVHYEQADNLHNTAYAKILDLLSVGEIQGLSSGDVGTPAAPGPGLQSVFLDGTPVMNPDGSLNFKGVSFAFRTGTQFQDYIPGFPAVENSVAVGVELKSNAPWTRQISNTQLSAVRIGISVPSEMKSNTENGDLTGYVINYAIDLSTDNGAYVEVLKASFDGKATNKYARSHRINLPKASIHWSIRVRRITANANSSAIQDITNIDSITEVIDAKLRYPMSALAGLQVDASQFQGVPVRSYQTKLRVIRVPSNYNPITRVYAGVWDGTFKNAWSNNPAWVFFDLVLHPIYGLGHLINSSQINKGALYQIAKYCDVMVSDGKGGQEPRFTANLYLQTQKQAYAVLQDIASIFRGISYWAAGSITTVADMPQDPVYTFTAANVIDGKFTRVGSSRKTRFNVALVSWNDPADKYKAKVEYVDDRDGIERYGIQQTSITAFGCTSQGQAQRAGQWILLTSRLETGSITFSVGLDAVAGAPGQIVRIADPARMGRRNAGRILGATNQSITLDKAPVIALGDQLTVILPTAVAETRTVTGFSGPTIRVGAPWSMLPQADSIWSVDNVDLVAPLYRILSVSEKGEGIYEVSATQHEPGKFAAIDNGTRIDARPETVIPPSVQPPPTNVVLSTFETVAQGIANSTLVIAWIAAPSAIAYEVEWRRNDGNWITISRVNQTSVEVPGSYAGRYLARVRALSVLPGVKSTPAYSVETVLKGKTTPPPVVTSLVTTGIVFGIKLAWGFPAIGASDTQRTEIWYSQTSSISDAIKLSDFAFPQNTHTMLGLAVGSEFWFWARLVDTSGNVGDFFPAGEGVFGHTNTDASAILDYISGQISRTQLAHDLLSDIDTTIDKTLALSDTVDAVNIEMVGIRARLEDLPDGAALNDIRAQQQNAVAQSDALAATQLIAIAAADQALSITRDAVVARLNKNEAGILDEKTARVTATEALATQITTVQSKFNGNIALVQDSIKTLVDDAHATASKLETVQSEFNGNKAVVQDQITTLVKADSATASRIDSVQSDFNNNKAVVQDQISTLANVDSATASKIETVQAQFNSNKAIVQDQITTLANSGSATASKIETVQAEFNSNKAVVQGQITTLANADSAAAMRIDSVQSEFNSNKSAVQGQITTLSSADSALGQRIDQVTATTGANTAAIAATSNAVAKTNGDLAALYSVRTQVTAGGIRYFAGFAVGVELNAGIAQSQFLVSANRFAIIDESNGVVSSPFVIQNGQTIMQAAIASSGTFSGKVKAGEFMTGSYTGYVWPAAGTSGTYLGPGGLLMGNGNDGKYIQITSDGNFYAPGMSIVNGSMTINQANVINTLQIAGNAVTVPQVVSGSAAVNGTSAAVVLIELPSMYLPQSGTILASSSIGQSFNGGNTWWAAELRIDGNTVFSTSGGNPADSISLCGALAVGPGYHSIQVVWTAYNGSTRALARTLWATGAMR